MIARQSGPMARRDARPLRFLLLSLGGWVILRTMILWNPAIPAPVDAASPPRVPASPFVAKASEDFGALPSAPAHWTATGAQGEGRARRALGWRVDGRPEQPGAPAFASGPAADRQALRLAPMARLPPAAGAPGALPANDAAWARQPPASRSEPAHGRPFWIQRSLSGWSLGGWLYLRDGSARAPGAIAAGGQLGGSQGGVRLSYGFGDSGRLRAYGRATIAIEQSRQRDVALGLAFAPIADLPIDVAVEQRVAIGNEGRTALAVTMAGGVGDVGLPGGFRLDAYAQAGLVGAQRRDGFVDGQVTIDRRLGRDERAPLRLGALVAGAVQPGAARVDIGPRLTFRLPGIGQGGRIALDWRQRVAGDARPESGVALTLAADF